MADLFAAAPQPERTPHSRRFNRLVEAHHRAALYLIERVEREGWKWCTNFLREYVRAAEGLEFSNTLSPAIYRELIKRYPWLAKYIDINPLTKR